MVSHEYLVGLQARFNELLNANEGDKIRKILAIDGKTQCANASDTQKANHIVSCVDEDGFCLGQELVVNAILDFFRIYAFAAAHSYDHRTIARLDANAEKVSKEVYC